MIQRRCNMGNGCTETSSKESKRIKNESASWDWSVFGLICTSMNVGFTLHAKDFWGMAFSGLLTVLCYVVVMVKLQKAQENETH